MYSKKLSIAVILALTLAAASVVLAQESALPDVSPKPVGLLDGKTFDGTVKLTKVPPDQIIKPMTETITFMNGMFLSTAFKAQGFADAPYGAKLENGLVIFAVSCVKADEPVVVLEWNGKVENSKTSNLSVLTATAKKSREGKIIEQYTISAKLRIVDAPKDQ